MIEEDYVALDSVVCGWEPTLDNPAQYQHITLKHLLTMTSGYDAVNTPTHANKWGKPGDDWSTTPSDPAQPRFEPGAYYLYWDDAVHLTHFNARTGDFLTGDKRAMQQTTFREKIALAVALVLVCLCAGRFSLSRCLHIARERT